MTPAERLKEIELDIVDPGNECVECSHHLVDSDGNWLIARVKKLTGALEVISLGDLDEHTLKIARKALEDLD